MFPCLQISAHNIDRAIWSFRDRDDLLAEVDRDAFRLDVVRGPGEVISEFLPGGYRRAIINEGNQAALRVEIVQKGYRRLGVAKGRKILEPAI